MHVFVSHAAADREAAARLRADLAQLGRQVAVDRGEPVGPDWWPGVLHRLRNTEVFVLVLSPDSARSPGCLAQLRQALALRRPVLLVPARPADAPPEVADAPVFDPADLGADRVVKLRVALRSLPSTPPLPTPLPPDPPVPYLEPYRERILDTALTEPELRTVFHELRARLREDPDRARVWALLVLLRDRQDVPRPVAGELERLLAPGWQPDPEHRVERRYWDGAEWTTLVRHEGREFSERRVPPPEATWSGSPRRPHLVDTPPRRPVRGRRRWLWVSGAAVACVAAVAAGWLWFSGPGPTPASVARTFVDAVNVRDVAALSDVACERVRPHAESSFLGGGYRLTLESVDDEADPPTFTVLTTNEATGAVDRRTLPFVLESGEWRVCG
ncbi:TIR domain-containing protein [Actinokineospora pegani]|uniref:TIR domain-containing protein n=1 Tax=Actinokineospora pegani TaxID=2654637 RepID=UPI0012E9E8D8|nr:TIR domain-containing protein [Actinokineospora pegani]